MKEKKLKQKPKNYHLYFAGVVGQIIFACIYIWYILSEMVFPRDILTVMIILVIFIWYSMNLDQYSRTIINK
jgi:hypothetical protein